MGTPCPLVGSPRGGLSQVPTRATRGFHLSYVKDNLVGDERIVFETKVNWSVYMPGITMALLSAVSLLWFVIAVASSGSEVGGGHIWLLFLAVGSVVLLAVFLVEGYVLTRTTEIAITTRRLIGKTGVLSRKTFEIQHDKVESVQFDQSPCARLFGAGTIAITGSGGTSARFKTIDRPQAFRGAALEAIDQSKG